ncbi:predicted protein [Lichtheimia corymbifera JMRC:FSU:9682]|uniref:Uncharacterized protein n=1 Tax=Lichtheimia corymbifera JMRC:FSU:9682 TaxID=1263082 RepID=A0A068RFY1_9FUNG|nr:predicted protein [Lichtheimia corymbifera JMRC:FSU:9682]
MNHYKEHCKGGMEGILDGLHASRVSYVPFFCKRIIRCSLQDAWVQGYTIVGDTVVAGGPCRHVCVRMEAKEIALLAQLTMGLRYHVDLSKSRAYSDTVKQNKHGKHGILPCWQLAYSKGGGGGVLPGTRCHHSFSDIS